MRIYVLVVCGSIISVSLIGFFVYNGVFKTNEADDELIVQLANPVGKVRGRSFTSSQGNEYYGWLGIPYSQPPVGDNRFSVPKPMNNWEGVLDATNNEKKCIQNVFEENASEDCLIINVYSPVKPGSNSSLPVYFVIYGGAFRRGSSSDLNPIFFMDYPMVVVTMNYRVGLLGCLTTNDGVIPANLGLKDQYSALKWTSENIHLFGGDPKKITLGGQSAGGTSAGYHLLATKNNGMIRAVIQQSGSSITAWGYQSNPRDVAFAAGKLLNPSFNSNSSKDLLEVLKNASVSDILAIQSNIPYNGQQGLVDDLNWAPCIEDENDPDAFVTGYMYENFITGNFNRVPLLIGFCSEETLFLLPGDSETLDTMIKPYDANASLIISRKFNIPSQYVNEAGMKLKEQYTTSFREDHGAFVRYSSDSGFIRPIIRQAEINSDYVPVYLFELSYSTTAPPLPGVEHVPHATDMQYLWPRGQKVNETIRQQMLKLWSNFIIHLNPTPEKDALLQNIVWPTVKSNGLQFLNINGTLTISSNQRNYASTKEIVDYYKQPPLITY